MNNEYRNNPHVYDEEINIDDGMYDVYNTRFDDRRYMDDDYYRRYDDMYRYYDDMYRYDRNYDRRYDRDRYYQYPPFCDRYGRCENPIWWLLWPMLFR
ncbi:hypothetical protein [Sedimentibacter sp.]|uniref:hypothetical protein n=1 Tax=Sedimentibacter sp. TaxID=1960295 RepID=UPI0028A2358F|nr:hypothetical protein [Sedimentibacter sp.]